MIPPMPEPLEPGRRAPDFDLPATGRGRLSAADLAGKPYVLFFFPKASTPG